MRRAVPGPGRQLGNLPQQVLGGGGFDAVAQFGAARAQPVDVGGGHPRSSETPRQGPGGVIEYRLGIVTGGEHHLPAAAGLGH